MRTLRIGLVATRFAGLDGVTLESAKVARVLEGLGHAIAWFGGQIETGFAPATVSSAAYFDTPHNHELNNRMFGRAECAQSVLQAVEDTAGDIEADLAAFVAENEIDVLMPQNALAIPMQVPLGLAIARYQHASGTPTLAHHHDFAWERKRFWPNAIGHFLDEAFPPVAPNLRHLVINSLAATELLRRKGVKSLLLPNIMDFGQPPAAGDAAAFRAVAGLAASDTVILQPTRMVPRKGIEETLRLAARLADESIRVVVTHPEPDEGSDYLDILAAAAEQLQVDFRVVPVQRGTGTGLGDAYAAADLVSYPSRIEGFGNALLEALYFKRPLLVNRYPVYVADIAPQGVEAIEMDGEITDGVVSEVAELLGNPESWGAAVDRNYDIGRRAFSYEIAAEILATALTNLVTK